MTEGGEVIDVEKVRVRLPDGWRVENDGEGVVYGYADDHASMNFSSSSEVPASFAIQEKEDLWVATWKDSHELGDGLHGLSDCTRGVRERCIEWVVEKARTTEGWASE